MKAGLLKKIARSYFTLFPADWKLYGSEIMRKEGDWVQIVSFNASRFNDTYVPRTALGFLKVPGPATASFLVQELVSSNGTQIGIKSTADINSVFERMNHQFRPAIDGHIRISEIRSRLEAGMSYWVYAHALCVIAAAEGNESDANRFFNAFVMATEDKPYPWVSERRNELESVLEKLSSPDLLKCHFEEIRIEKLKALKLSP